MRSFREIGFPLSFSNREGRYGSCWRNTLVISYGFSWDFSGSSYQHTTNNNNIVLGTTLAEKTCP